MIFVYITAPDEKTANQLIHTLLQEKLIACANAFPTKSSYVWEDKIETAQEISIIAKSMETLFLRVKQRVKELHPYKVPCISMIKVEANDAFEQWISTSVGS